MLKIKEQTVIAEFIQAEKQDDNLYMYNGLSYYLQEMHRDWNFLMVAVEKIESLGFVVMIGRNTCVIEQTFNKTSIDLGSIKGNNKIEAVYNACIEFINWYNKKPNKK